jgi:hypothetical protein
MVKERDNSVYITSRGFTLQGLNTTEVSHDVPYISRLAHENKLPEFTERLPVKYKSRRVYSGLFPSKSTLHNKLLLDDF